MPGSRLLLILTLISLTVLSVLTFFNGCKSAEVELSGVVRVREYALGSRIGGEVEEALVQEGQEVKKGALLVRLDDSKLLVQRIILGHTFEGAQASYNDLRAGATREDKERARAELAAVEAEYQKTLSGFRSEDIAAAEAEVRALEAEFENVRKEAERMERLFADGVISESQRDAAVSGRDAMAARVEAVKENFSKLTRGLQKEDIEAAEAAVSARKAVLKKLLVGATKNQLAAALAKVRQVQAELARLDLDIADLDVTAPADGVVEEIIVEQGEIAAPGQTIISFIASDDIWVDLYVPENALGWVKVGDKLRVLADPFPDKPFEAEIFFISREAEFTPRNIFTPEERVNQVYRMKLRPRNPSFALRAGMNVSAFLVGK